MSCRVEGCKQSLDFSEQREDVKPIERSEKGLTKGAGSGRTRSPLRLRVCSQRRQQGDAEVHSLTFGLYSMDTALLKIFGELRKFNEG